MSDSLAALMALAMADLSRSQRETLMNLIFQRGVELTALTVDQLDEFLITLFMLRGLASRNPVGLARQDPDLSLPFHTTTWVNMKATGCRMRSPATRAFSNLDEHEDIFWIYDEEQYFWMKHPFQGRSLNKGGKSKGKGKKGKSKRGKGSGARRFFRPYRKRGGKGERSGKVDSSSARKANITEEEVEEEEAEHDALLTNNKKKKRRPHAKKKGKSQPTSSTAHEADCSR